MVDGCEIVDVLRGSKKVRGTDQFRQNLIKIEIRETLNPRPFSRLACFTSSYRDYYIPPASFQQDLVLKYP